MSVPVTKQTMSAAYELLRILPPFSRWDLPPAKKITFRRTRSNCDAGYYDYRTGTGHIIAIAPHERLHDFLSTMAHEMVHLHQIMHPHDGEFKRAAGQICATLGFNQKEF